MQICHGKESAESCLTIGSLGSLSLPVDATRETSITSYQYLNQCIQQITHLHCTPPVTSVHVTVDLTSLLTISVVALRHKDEVMCELQVTIESPDTLQYVPVMEVESFASNAKIPTREHWVPR
jgi:hypothetical protein